MRAYIVAVAVVCGLAVVAQAEDKKPAGTAKGAAVGALAGHEVGSGHAVAGAATGAAIGHHQQAKAEKNKEQPEK
jgi:outer membrane lipoprotein SlyB